MLKCIFIQKSHTPKTRNLGTPGLHFTHVRFDQSNQKPQDGQETRREEYSIHNLILILILPCSELESLKLFPRGGTWNVEDSGDQQENTQYK